MIFTFGLLALSICAVWFPSIPTGARGRLPAWIPIWIAAIAVGLFAGYLTFAAPISLGLLAGLAWLAQRGENSRLQRGIFGWATALLGLALALHRVPGFYNPILIDHLRLSADAAPFTLYANFDKASVGLILVALLCKRTKTLAEWVADMRKAIPIALITMVVVLVTAMAIGFVRPEFKVSSFTPIFLLTNLLFTCVAEEAFFRGLLQDRLAAVLKRSRSGEWIAIVVSALLFGLTHIGGGMVYVILASLGGLGSAYAYYRTQRIEAAIVTHFVLNAVHFIGFTYPNLQ
jgi:membrane protease YdiL (CAAX protease family)